MHNFADQTIEAVALRVGGSNLKPRMAVGLLLIATAAHAAAPDPLQTDGDKYRAIVDNACVRVLEYRDRPGERTQAHHHPAFTLIALSGFERTLTLPDGRVLRRRFQPGDVMWSPAQTHVGENVGSTPTHVVIVEPKPGAAADPACAPG